MKETFLFTFIFLIGFFFGANEAEKLAAKPNECEVLGQLAEQLTDEQVKALRILAGAKQ